MTDSIAGSCCEDLPPLRSVRVVWNRQPFTPQNPYPTVAPTLCLLRPDIWDRPTTKTLLSQIDIGNKLSFSARHCNAEDLRRLPTATCTVATTGDASDARPQPSSGSDEGSETGTPAVASAGTGANDRSQPHEQQQQRQEPSSLLRSSTDLVAATAVAHPNTTTDSIDHNAALSTLGAGTSNAIPHTGSVSRCAICLAPFEAGVPYEVRRMANCDHYRCFHRVCLDRWLLGTSSNYRTNTNCCPVCKAPATDISSEVAPGSENGAFASPSSSSSSPGSPPAEEGQATHKPPEAGEVGGEEDQDEETGGFEHVDGSACSSGDEGGSGGSWIWGGESSYVTVEGTTEVTTAAAAASSGEENRRALTNGSVAPAPAADGARLGMMPVPQPGDDFDIEADVMCGPLSPCSDGGGFAGITHDDNDDDDNDVGGGERVNKGSDDHNEERKGGTVPVPQMILSGLSWDGRDGGARDEDAVAAGAEGIESARPAATATAATKGTDACAAATAAPPTSGVPIGDIPSWSFIIAGTSLQMMDDDDER